MIQVFSLEKPYNFMNFKRFNDVTDFFLNVCILIYRYFKCRQFSTVAALSPLSQYTKDQDKNVKFTLIVDLNSVKFTHIVGVRHYLDELAVKVRIRIRLGYSNELRKRIRH